MAKVTCNYDTETKELSINIDGVNYTDPQHVSFYSEDKNYGYFEAVFKDIDQNGIRLRLSAHGSEVSKSSTLEDLVREVLIKK